MGVKNHSPLDSTSMPSKMDTSVVSLQSDTEPKVLRSIIPPCWLRLPSAVKPSLNDKNVARPFLLLGPKLLVVLFGEEPVPLLKPDSARPSRLLANEYTRR
jgi:hypothetical protein